MAKATVKMIASMVSHMPLLVVWQASGVTQRHGFDLTVDVCDVKINGQPFVRMNERAPRLLDGSCDFVSGLHHEPYFARAQGDKRLVFLAQAQNNWDDRVIVSKEIRSAKDLEGRKFIVTSWGSCCFDNLKHCLRLAGADPERIDFIDGANRFGLSSPDSSSAAVERLARGDAVAAIVDPPFDRRAEKLGMRCLELPDVPVIHNVTICANADSIRENEEITVAFLKSMIDAIHFFKTEKSLTCEILERNYAPIVGSNDPGEVEHLQQVWAALLNPKPFPHPLALWNVYELEVARDPRANFVGPLEVWDTGYLKMIDDSGYIDKLYGNPLAAANPMVYPAI